MKYVIYCTKGKPNRIVMDCVDNKGNKSKRCVPCLNPKMAMNGKVVVEFDGEVELIDLPNSYSDLSYILSMQDKINDICEKSCLSKDQLYSYLKDHKGYLIHINNLHIFDKSKDPLKDYYAADWYPATKNSEAIGWTDPMVRVPRNMMQVTEKKWTYNTYKYDDIKIMISVHPDLVEEIINGKVTILIRKKVITRK